MNAWSAFSQVVARPEVAVNPRVRRVHLLAAGAAVPVVAAILAIAIANSPTSARIAPPTPSVAEPDKAAAQVLATLEPSTPKAAEAEPDSVRVTGRVGQDLTRSLRAAGIPERQGREYVAALATAIKLDGGLSVEDRFDVVMLKHEGKFGEVAYAGLDRVGRSDVQLMKWTNGNETRWVDADGLDDSEGMEIPVSGRVTSGFGQRFHPVLGYRRMHAGLDLAAPYGTPIVAAASGRVASAGWRGGYGREVAVVHDGGVETLYGHMSRIAVSAGTHVRRGSVIGYVGSTGLSTGPHLHYEVHLKGKRVNPLTVKLVDSPLKDEELHAFQSRLRGLLMQRPGRS